MAHPRYVGAQNVYVALMSEINYMQITSVQTSFYYSKNCANHLYLFFQILSAKLHRPLLSVNNLLFFKIDLIN